MTDLSAVVLEAIASTVLDLFIGLLVAAAILGLAVAVGRCIHGAETPPFEPQAEPASAADLDDWLASEEPLREFKLWERPKASTDSKGRRRV